MSGSPDHGHSHGSSSSSLHSSLLENDGAYREVDDEEVAHGHSHGHNITGPTSMAMNIIEQSKQNALAKEAAAAASAKKARCK